MLALEVPDDAADLPRELKDQLPDLAAFALSFAVLARLWMFHHRLFGALAEFDGKLIGLNFLYLAFIVLVPFTSEMIGDYGDDSVAVIVYATSMACVALVGSASFEYAFRAGLVTPAAAHERRFYTGAPNWILPGVFLASIPVALVAPFVATMMWLLIFALGIIARERVGRHRAGND